MSVMFLLLSCRTKWGRYRHMDNCPLPHNVSCPPTFSSPPLPLLFLHRHQLVNFSLSYQPGMLGRCSVSQMSQTWEEQNKSNDRHTLAITSLIDIHNHTSHFSWCITSFQIVWFWQHVQTNFQCRNIELSKQDNILQSHMYCKWMFSNCEHVPDSISGPRRRMLHWSSELKVKTKSPIYNLTVSLPEWIPATPKLDHRNWVDWVWLRPTYLSTLKICRVELCTELFYAIIPTLFLCFLLICYPCILLHF